MVQVDRSLRALVLVSLLVLPIASCANSGVGQALQKSLAADPKLEESAPDGTLDAIAEIEPSPPTVQLPADFPNALAYPNATLQAVNTLEATEQAQSSPATTSLPVRPSTSTEWRTADSRDQVLAFYQNKLQTDGWQLKENSLANSQGTVVAENDDWQVTIRVPPDPTTPLNQTAEAATQFAIAYAPMTASFPSPQASLFPSPSPTTNPSPQPLEVFLGAEGETDGNSAIASSPTTTPATPSPSALPPNQYTDLNQVPKELQRYVTDLAQLGVLELTPGNNKTKAVTTFAPNKPVSRREYARWLFAAHNQLYADQSGQLIRPGNRASQPAFRDIPPSDRDYAAIQGLAEAGIIPSMLSGDATAVTFRPDAQLSRETMLLWKVPMDTRQPLPTATLSAIQQAWSFQDAAKIDPKAQRAVLADYQNGDRSNIRRVFGYTTLFQPKKPVTRAEAAASLWHFGYQSDGVSAGQLTE